MISVKDWLIRTRDAEAAQAKMQNRILETLRRTGDYVSLSDLSVNLDVGSDMLSTSIGALLDDGLIELNPRSPKAEGRILLRLRKSGLPTSIVSREQRDRDLERAQESSRAAVIRAHGVVARGLRHSASGLGASR